MSAAIMNNHTSNGNDGASEGLHDPFTDNSTVNQPHSHRYSSYLDLDSFILEAAGSPSQAKRTLQAHLSETERRLQETHQLGTTLLKQQTELAEKLKEVEQRQDGEELPQGLRKRLVELGKEHDDVGKEIARAMLAPRSRIASGEDKQIQDSPAAFASQATGSPSKISVPNRKHRNLPSARAGDIQFAADISTSLLAQVRQLQAVLAERDETLKTTNAENSRLEHEAAGFSQRLRTLDESEQRYKDENWNLETKHHELDSARKESADREKRLNAALAAAVTEKSRAQSELDDIKVAHSKLTDDHAAAKKAHDGELHALKRTLDVHDNERTTLKSRLEELTSQNQELALAFAGRSRNQPLPTEPDFGGDGDGMSRDLSTPDHSPPPSPTKGTPRHGGLESETLKSSLHHAHRMIQNLKGNIHREKTEKIELKRMLQDARDELEQRRADGGLSSGSKRQKTRPETFKKPLGPNMLGGNRKARTDVEVQDEGWEDHTADGQSSRRVTPGSYPLSDAYQTSNETESAFETADEHHATESEAFETGAESLAGDSNDDLTETEDTIGRSSTFRRPNSTAALKQAGNRSSFLSTASTSAGEEDDVRTPVQGQSSKFRLKNGKQSLSRQSQVPAASSPSIFLSQGGEQDSPATTATERSPPGAEQSLFAELAGFDDASSDRYNTPGRASIASVNSPSSGFDTIRSGPRDITPTPFVKIPMVDSSTMTEDGQPELSHAKTLGTGVAGATLGAMAGYAVNEHEHGDVPTSPSDFPLPPTGSESPTKNAETGTQYTPNKTLQASPMRSLPNFITPPKTVWDEAQGGEAATHRGDLTPTQTMPQNIMGFSGLLTQDTQPLESQLNQPIAPVLGFSSINSLETAPTEIPGSYADSPTLAASDPHIMNSKSETSEKGTAAAAGAGVGILATAAAALGLSKSKESSAPVISEDHTSQSQSQESNYNSARAQKMPLTNVSGNSSSRPGIPNQDPLESENVAPLKAVTSSDQGAQTMLTSEHIERALRKRAEPQPSAAAVTPTMSAATPSTPRGVSRGRDSAQIIGEAVPMLSATALSKRPASSNSHKAPSFNSQHPPLPVDHRTAIAKASGSGSVNGRVASPVSVTDPYNSSHVSTIMGPPIAPASAYRRSRTPTGQSITSPSRDGTTPRVSYRQRNAAGSQMSRRSSVSSFASELDERFNIRTDQPTATHGFEASAGTDPRMIQAITQTMIGEFLWKYTRKPGRTDMSNTRHSRYFWVHPYTKTLYWSDQDPQTAGRNELKAKSVAIHSVRVVSDDNPMPPGLHRKSIEVITPGRKIKFTAPTAQRHDTWFNALSYLLLRGDEPITPGAYAPGGSEITNEDINEFNAGYTRPTLTTSTSRMSMSSYNSRTTRGTSTNRASSRMSLRQGLPAGYKASTTTAAASSRLPQDFSTVTTHSSTRLGNPDQNHIGTEAHQQSDRDSTVRGTSSSRFSRMMSSMTGRSRSDAELLRGESQTRPAREGNSGSIYNASVVSDDGRRNSAEVKKELLKQEREGDRLENVRACCDGKHDVSTLAAGGRHSHHHHGSSSRHASIDRLSRSVNRRNVGTIAGPSAGTAGQGIVQVN